MGVIRGLNGTLLSLRGGTQREDLLEFPTTLLLERPAKGKR